MFQYLMAAFCKLLCILCDCCEGHKDCPDGVCDPLRDAITYHEKEDPQPTAQGVQSVDPDWSRINFVIEAAVALVKELRRFLFRK